MSIIDGCLVLITLQYVAEADEGSRVMRSFRGRPDEGGVLSGTLARKPSLIAYDQLLELAALPPPWPVLLCSLLVYDTSTFIDKRRECASSGREAP